jgi:Na+/proline symporter
MVGFTSLHPLCNYQYYYPKGYSAADVQKGYYNKAIAAHPISALPGYIMGGLSWFAIPWLCATTMGLSALALEGNPNFPTYPHRLSDAQVSAGLVLPNAAVALLGQGGAVCTLIMVFMAVTSASSAELIAVSTIFTYDIYQSVVISPHSVNAILTSISGPISIPRRQVIV